jgi:hypothetical protein
MGKSPAAALLNRESKEPRMERGNGSLMVEEAPLFAGFEGEGEVVGRLVVAATVAEVGRRGVWGSSVPIVVAATVAEVGRRVVSGPSVPTVKVLDPWTMHIRCVLEAHTIGGISLGVEGVVEIAFGPLERGVAVWAAVIVNVVDLVGVMVNPDVERGQGKEASLRLRRPDADADAADIRDASVQKRSRRNGILMLDAPPVAAFDVAEGEAPVILDAPLVAAFDVADGEAPAIVGGGFVAMWVVSGGDTVSMVKVLVPATAQSRFVFDEQGPMLGRVREEAWGKVVAQVSVVTVIVGLLSMQLQREVGDEEAEVNTLATSTLGEGLVIVPAAREAKWLSRSKKNGIFTLDDPLVAAFEGVGGAGVVVTSVGLSTGASVPDPVTGTMKFDGNAEGDEGPGPESAWVGAAAGVVPPTPGPNVGFCGAVNPVAIEVAVPPPYGVSVGVVAGGAPIPQFPSASPVADAATALREETRGA